MSNRIIRFGLEMTFPIIICTGAVMYPRDATRLIDLEEKTRFELFLIGYTITLGVLTLAFLIFTCLVTSFCSRKSVIIASEVRMIENKRVIDDIRLKFLEKRAAKARSNSVHSPI